MPIPSALRALDDTKELMLFACIFKIVSGFVNFISILRSIYKYETDNREPGIGNWFLVPYLSKREGYFETVDRIRESGTGNRELVSCSLFGYVIPMFQKCKSGIRNQFPVPF